MCVSRLDIYRYIELDSLSCLHARLFPRTTALDAFYLPQLVVQWSNSIESTYDVCWYRTKSSPWSHTILPVDIVGQLPDQLIKTIVL